MINKDNIYNKLNIEIISVDELKEYENNVKLHPKEQIEQIKKSISNFNMIDPIGIDEDNVIIEGHGRLEACKELGYKEVPCIRLTHLNEEQKNAYRLIHNQLTMNSGFDLQGLKDELDKITLDMSEFSFDLTEIQNEISKLNDKEKEIIEDDVPEVKETSVKRGDIYILDSHRLMCGDSKSSDDVNKLLNGNKIDMIYTDPPYGMNLNTDFSSMKSNLNFVKDKNFIGGKKYNQGIVDDFNPKMIEMIMSLNVKETFLWGADYFAEFLPNKNNGSWIVWDKRANGNDDIEQDYLSDKMYGSCFELCWSKTKHKRDIARIKWAGIFGKEQEFDHKRHHPTQKPIKLSQWFLEKYSKENDNILDLFGGSGSTLIACEQLNRKCYMMEIDEYYCQVIISRWEKLTGKKAKKVEV